jgi:excinuclease ABC subunit A
MIDAPAARTAGDEARVPGAGRRGGQVVVVGAREHNLDIDHLVIPKQELVVFTGVSGSGKSSLAFDTLYAEGQRRYIESLTSYARQFLGRLDRPDVERLSGLSPTIAIEQKSASSNPRSTVGTITEVYDYLRVLYARLGQQHCHRCGARVQGQSAQEVVDAIFELPAGSRLLVLAPLVAHRKGEFRDLFGELAARGFLRVRVDGEVRRLDELPALDKRRKHTLELVVDRVTLEAGERQRVAEAVELALEEGKGEVLVAREGDEAPPRRFSEARTCCGHSFPALTPQSFSFNHPLGMCQECHGLGTLLEVDPALVVPDESLSIRQGAIALYARSLERDTSWTSRIFKAMANACEVDLDTPWARLSERKRRQVLYGLGERRIRVTWGQAGTETEGSWGMRFEGVINTLARRYHQTTSEAMRELYRQYMSEQPCEACGGRRLRPESLAVLLEGRNIAEVSAMTVREAHRHFVDLRLEGARRQIAHGVLREVRSRLEFLLNVGLDYLSLSRGGPTLSGGEAQRIRLASQLGSELSGVMYVLDEPSIGLHQRDNRRLVETLKGLRDLGNTVIVVEHDEETIRSADHVVDFGPGAGHLGGKVVFSGAPADLVRCEASLTGQYLAGSRSIAVPARRRAPEGWLVVRGAAQNNLRDIDVAFPLRTFVAVTGVSGAGKSSLVSAILLPALRRTLLHGTEAVGRHRALEGAGGVDRVIAIDQKPIGRTPRSNPGTYTKAFDEVREVFASLPEARARGYGPSRFSFNVKGGRCEACHGDGVVKVEMHFLADVYVPCEVCGGKRFNDQTLQVRYKGRNIAEVLDLSVDDCLELFSPYPKLARILRTLVDVGLGYVKLGQSAPTLSGGEAQRVKLSRELGKRQTGRTLYVLDEPTTGLHFDDVRKLLEVLQLLTDQGNTVVVIEHNLEVVKCADWIIDLGPEGGERGGLVVAEGPPEELCRAPRSHTARYLAPLLEPPRDRPLATSSVSVAAIRG